MRIKRIWVMFTASFLVVVVALLLWWALGREGGSGHSTFNFSIVSETLYGAGSGGIVRVKQGDAVTLRITADEPMLVHLHGYDLETEIVPEEASTLQFTATVVGHHPFMIHRLGADREVEILLGWVEVVGGR